MVFLGKRPAAALHEHVLGGIPIPMPPNEEPSDIAYISCASLVNQDATNQLYLRHTERLLSANLWLKQDVAIL